MAIDERSQTLRRARDYSLMRKGVTRDPQMARNESIVVAMERGEEEKSACDEEEVWALHKAVAELTIDAERFNRLRFYPSE